MMMFMYTHIARCCNLTSAFSDSLSIIFPPDSEVKLWSLEQWAPPRNTYKQSSKGPIPTFIPNTKEIVVAVKAEKRLELVPLLSFLLQKLLELQYDFQGLFPFQEFFPTQKTKSSVRTSSLIHCLFLASTVYRVGLKFRYDAIFGALSYIFPFFFLLFLSSLLPKLHFGVF